MFERVKSMERVEKAGTHNRQSLREMCALSLRLVGVVKGVYVHAKRALRVENFSVRAQQAFFHPTTYTISSILKKWAIYP